MLMLLQLLLICWTNPLYTLQGFYPNCLSNLVGVTEIKGVELCLFHNVHSIAWMTPPLVTGALPLFRKRKLIQDLTMMVSRPLQAHIIFIFSVICKFNYNFLYILYHRTDNLYGCLQGMSPSKWVLLLIFEINLFDSCTLYS